MVNLTILSPNFRRVHEGYESDPPVYTAKEAAERIKTFMTLISKAKKEQ